ncbi:MAG: hypothetical protein IMY71_08880 [Bacteroidetes bacterium]|nr:hypothetical protein [Bacteroidota bacterium]
MKKIRQKAEGKSLLREMRHLPCSPCETPAMQGATKLLFHRVKFEARKYFTREGAYFTVGKS